MIEAARAAIRCEIERIVLEAQEAGVTVRAGYHAAMLLIEFPEAGWSLGRIIDEIIAAASVAKIPVEMSRD